MSAAGTRFARSPPPKRRVASLSRRSGRVKRPAIRAPITSATRSAPSTVTTRSVVTVARVYARVVYGFARVTFTPHGTDSPVAWTGPKTADAWSVSRLSRTSGGAVSEARVVPPGAAVTITSPAEVWVAPPISTLTSAFATAFARKLRNESALIRSATVGLRRLPASTTGSDPDAGTATTATMLPTSRARAVSAPSSCSSKYASSRLTTIAETTRRTAATSATTMSVSRARNDRGTMRPRRRTPRRGASAWPLTPGASALDERVPDSPHGQDEDRRRRVVLDLLAKVADVDVDRLLVLVERLVVPQELQQLAPRVDAPGAGGEMPQDLELGRREVDLAACALDAPALQVDEEVVVAQDAPAPGIGEVAVGAPEQRLDPAHQLAQAERLGEVVVRPELEADDLVHLVVPGGQDQNRHLSVGRTDPAQDLKTVHARQADVEDDQVGRLVRREVQPLLAGPGDRDLVPLLLEGVLDAARDRVLVFDDQDGARHCRPDRTPAEAAALLSRARVSLLGAARGSARRSPWLRSTSPGLGAWYPHSSTGRPAPSGRAAAPSRDRPDRTERPAVSTDRPTLAALPRTEMGKATSHLRKAGRIPAVVFGHGDSTSVSVDAHEFEQLRRRAGANALIDLEVEGSKATPVIINGVQLHRVNRTPLHVDLFRVKMTEDMTVDVAVHSFGEAEAVTKEGGTLIHAVDHVRVRARPDRLPKFIEVDVSTLATFEAVIAVRDLPVRPGRDERRVPRERGVRQE